MVVEMGSDNGVGDGEFLWLTKVFSWGYVLVWGECHCGECALYCKDKILLCLLSMLFFLFISIIHPCH